MPETLFTFKTPVGFFADCLLLNDWPRLYFFDNLAPEEHLGQGSAPSLLKMRIVEFIDPKSFACVACLATGF